jgi:hypothetical protein
MIYDIRCHYVKYHGLMKSMIMKNIGTIGLFRAYLKNNGLFK